ncbi:MFS transporter [Streptococcus parasanguinis]|uniref:MFS transporter n=1 Tax=Streptococcus parasanguinis TaxID=1318 RepID=UPI003219305A
MKKTMERISLLSLSLMLISSFSITAGLPAMKAYFSQLGYSAGQVELLVSLPAFAVVAMLFLNSLIERWMSERQMIVAGLLLFSTSGLLPLVVRDYPLIFLSRLIFGLGTGMINAKAISIISERYSGNDKTRMLGYRGSAEVVGSAILTFIVGQLLPLGWPAIFTVYGGGYLILLLYILFVPYPKEKKQASLKEKKKGSARLRSPQWRFSLMLAVIAGIIICFNSIISLRVPDIIVDARMGTATTAGTVLSLMQLTGIVAGVGFASLTHVFKKNLLMIMCFGFGLALTLIGLSGQLWSLVLGTLLAGFTYSTGVTSIFYHLSEKIPTNLLNLATSLVLIGCNLGSALSSFFIQLVTPLAPSNHLLFVWIGALMVLTGVFASQLLARTK